MSTVTNFRVERRSWRGYDDPGLPSGAWVAEGEVTGDASGGVAEVRFLFQIPSDPLSGRMWSVEQVSINVVAETAQEVLLRTQNMDFLASNRVLDARNAMIPLVTDTNLGVTGSRMSDKLYPWFLGRPTSANLECGLRVIWNNVNTVDFRAVLQGFTWEPAALLAPGGVRRPADALWG